MKFILGPDGRLAILVVVLVVGILVTLRVLAPVVHPNLAH